MNQPQRSLSMMPHRYRHSQLSAIVLAVVAAVSPAFGATLTFDNGAGTLLYSTATNWVGDTLPAAGDDVVFDNSATTLTGTTIGLGGNSAANSITFGSVNGTALGAFTLNNNLAGTVNRTLTLTTGNVTVDASVTGTQTLGALAGVGVIQLANSSGGVQFTNNSTTQGLVLGPFGYVSAPNVTFSSAGGLITFDLGVGPTLGSLNGGTSTTVSVVKTGVGTLRTLTLSGTGSHTFGGAITGTGVTGPSGLALTISGANSSFVQTLTADNGLGADVTVTTGTLLLNGANTGVGPYSVGASGTLGGSGSIASTNSRKLSTSAGAKFAPGSALGTVGTFSVNLSNLGSTIDLSTATNDTGTFVFDLATTAASDKLVLSTGGGAISFGTVNAADFSFTLLGGFGAGTYTLLDMNRAITGTVDTTTFALGGFDAALSYDAVGNDVLLTVTVVPEPSTPVALLGGFALLFGTFRKRSRRMS